jgi:mono/diheme cytochrome c family protein
MKAKLLGAALAAALAVTTLQAQTPFAPRDEDVESLPAGAGREETFGMCSACHGFRLVQNQGQTRAQWDDTLNLMTSRHGMPAIEGADRELILDYLAQHYPPRAPARGGGFRNPFAQ